MSVDEAESGLVRRARDGDREAFAGLVERHWARLVRLARSVGGDADAEDVVQEGFILAWRNLGSLREVEAFSSWLTRIVSRVCLHAARKAQPLMPLEGFSEPITTEGSMEAALDVESIIGSLAPRQRAVMHLTVVEGMSDTDIGEVLAMKPSSVRSHRRRARQALSQLLVKKGTRRWVKAEEIP